jgi:hypothetical protein
VSTAGTHFEERVGELAGPMLVKEVRQGLRARSFTVVFALSLLALFLAALWVAALQRGSPDEVYGPKFFTWVMVFLGAGAFFVLPITGARSMQQEREGETWVLLMLTGLSGRRIAFGKYLAVMSQALLLGSAAAPFLVFSYFLNGVPLTFLLIMLPVAAIWSSFLVAVGIALGSQAKTKQARGVSFMSVILLMGLLAGISLMFVLAVTERPGALDRDELRFMLAVLTFLMLGGTVVCLEAAGASLHLVSEATVWPVRRAVLGFFVIGWACGLATTFTPWASSDEATIGSLLTGFVLMVVGLFSCSEPDGWPRVSLAQGWRRPGALRGFGFTLALALGSTLVWALLLVKQGSASSSLDRRMAFTLALPCYLAFCLAAAVYVARVTPFRRLGEPVATRVSFAVVVTLGILLPILFSLLLRNKADARGPNLLNPVFGLASFAESYDMAGKAGRLGFLGFLTALMVVLAWVVLLGRDQERA